MKLWEYLKSKMVQFGDKIAFGNSGLTYKEIINFTEGSLNKRKLVLCDHESREEQAKLILETIAMGDVVVPVTKKYGLTYYKNIKKLVKENCTSYVEDLAFLMFTSGTTGEAKGVMLSDENIISNLQYIDTYFNLNGMKTICISRPLVHIAVLTGELLFALCNGLTIYFYEEEFMPHRILKYCKDNSVDVFCSTPTLYKTIAMVDKNSEFDIKIGVVSGETLTENIGKFLAQKFTKTKFYNVYGLTEHSPRVSALCPEDFMIKVGSVGKPIGDVLLKIKDGELLVKSKSVMKGYFLNDKKTKEKICDGWLKTGDLAHFDKDGYLYIDGRKDNMIVRSGLKIYPEEIEKECIRVVGVEDSIVFTSLLNEEVIICMKYVGEINENDLRKELLACLNPSIVPQKIEKVETIERTVSGKKIRK